MASSLVLTGGAAFTKTLKDTHNQPGHGFVEGDVVRYDAASQRFVKARADTAANAEVLGVVNAYIGDIFELTYAGLITLSGLPASISSAPVLFLSSTVDGKLEASPPSAVGTVVKAVLTRDKGNNYIVTNYLGTQIGGSSTIAVDEIQPVGTIMPFAGSIIPETWLECNGATYNRVVYPELYSKLCFTDGDQVPMYGYVVGVTGAGAYDTIQRNDVVHFKNSSASEWQPSVGAGPYAQGSNDDIRAVVIDLPNASVPYLQLSVIPKYVGGRFVYQNAILKTGNASSITSNYRIWRADNGQQRTVSGFTVTGVSILQFRTPDLRGRFALGSNSVGLSDNATENDPLFISSLGTYAMGSLGGEEAHALTNTELPSHSHSAGTLATTSAGSHTHGYLKPTTGTDTMSGGDTHYINAANDTTTSSGEHTHSITGLVGATGANSPHNNMPPYTTVLYIIKAKPYTRAAIIEGVDIPYSSLLVRDLRSRNVGGPSTSENNINDLVICTNKNDVLDSGIGTERIRIKGNTGLVGIGKNNPVVELDVTGTAAFSSRVGIGKTDPQVALDIVGQARSSILLGDYASAPNSTLTTKEYVNSVVPLSVNMYNATPTLLAFSYTCVGWKWNFDDNGNYITNTSQTPIGEGMFHMPAAGIALNDIKVLNEHGFTRNAATWSTAVLPVGTWDICCFMFSNRGPGPNEASDDDKYTFYRCFSARLVSTSTTRANVVDWLITKGFGRLIADASGGISNYRGHQAGNGFAVRVS